MANRRLRSPMNAAEKQGAWGQEFTNREDEYLDEVEQRWGDTDAYAQSSRKVGAHGPEEWEQINASNAAVETRLRELIDLGVAPESAEAMDVAEAQRLHISKWFYVMDHAFHVQKSDLYVHEPKFREGIERNTRPGAAEWLQAAIIANAQRSTG